MHVYNFDLISSNSNKIDRSKFAIISDKFGLSNMPSSMIIKLPAACAENRSPIGMLSCTTDQINVIFSLLLCVCSSYLVRYNLCQLLPLSVVVCRFFTLLCNKIIILKSFRMNELHKAIGENGMNVTTITINNVGNLWHREPCK